MMRHPHADLIKEWAEDTSRVLEYKNHNADKWFTWISGPSSPDFDPEYEWRFRPEPKPDVVLYRKVCDDIGWAAPTPDANIKLTFDGETGKLKSAEVIDGI